MKLRSLAVGAGVVLALGNMAVNAEHYYNLTDLVEMHLAIGPSKESTLVMFREQLASHPRGEQLAGLMQSQMQISDSMYNNLNVVLASDKTSSLRRFIAWTIALILFVALGRRERAL